ncbi:MAG: hypothetical protein ACFWUD_03830 [Thermocaproicibacter melissae]|jgi:glycosyltransferase involved in cell wall biosynthesis|uniref:glycosyltransferase n=1 Tax=Thermocaproicibacter melissae TaxID=2966552 RepID=UPI003A0FE0BD
MNQPKVSIIVPVYNVEKYLEQCLDSILQQTLRDIQIIIADDGEHNKCREIIDRYERLDSRIISIHQPVNGYGARINLCMKSARGEYVGIVEPDDFIDPDMYESLYTYATSLNADIVKAPFYGYYDAPEGMNSIRKDCGFSEYVTSNTPSNKLFSVQDYPIIMSVHASLWSGIYRRSYLEEKNIQFIEARGAGYVDVLFRLDTMLNTNKIAWLNKPFYNYRVTSEESSTTKWNNMTMLTRWKEAHEKYCHGEMYNNSVGPQIFCDEHCNTLHRIYFSKFTVSEYFQCWRNFSYIKTDYMMKAPLLPEKERKDAVYFKKHPILFILKRKIIERMNTQQKDRVKRILTKLKLLHQ